MSCFRWPNAAILCITGLALSVVPPARASDNLRLDDNVAPTFQAISLVVDADQKSYTGSVHVELQVQKRTNSFRFHAEEMKLDKIVLRRAASGNKEPSAIDLHMKEGKPGLVDVTTKLALEPGNYTLDMDF